MQENPSQITEVEILSEIAEARKTDPNLREYLNNFGLLLPGQTYRMFSESLGLMNKTPGEWMKKIDVDALSVLRRSQTDGKFYEIIDNTLIEAGVDLDKAKDSKIQQTPEFSNLVLPGYIKLRLLGYNRYPDLTQ